MDLMINSPEKSWTEEKSSSQSENRSCRKVRKQSYQSTSYTLMANSIETKNYPLAILAPPPYSLLPDIVTVLIFFNLKLKRTLVSLGTLAFGNCKDV